MQIKKCRLLGHGAVNLAKSFLLMLSEIFLTIFVPYIVGALSFYLFQGLKNKVLIWVNGFCWMLAFALVFLILLVIWYALVCVVSLTALLLLIWINVNWRWATGDSNLECVDSFYEKIENFLSKLGVSRGW